jgi:serine/threonine-protein kinase
LILILSAVAVIVLVLGALGIWLIAKPDDSSSGVASSETSETTSETETTERTTRRPPRTAAPENPDPSEAKLLALLPRGYDDGVCQPVQPPVGGALSTVECGASSMQGGPTSARYSLFADQGALDSAFDQTSPLITEFLQCPGSGTDSPTTWHYTETPDQVEGRIACGTYNTIPDVMWTKNADLLMGDSLGENIDDLHNWWLKYG